jgi:subtilisin-like proprotein convertase family protein
VTASGNARQVAADVPMAIPDLGSARSTVRLPNAFTVASLSVSLKITHSYPEDLTITLASPRGATTTLAENDYSGGTRTFTTSALAGEAGKGTWELVVSDGYFGDSGTLESWEINFSASGSAYSGSDGVYSLTGMPSGFIYAITPGLAGRSFVPASQTIGVTADTTGVDFDLLDTFAPILQFTTPAGRANYLPALNNIAGTASDEGGGTGLARVAVRVRRAPGDGSAIAGRYWNGTAWQSGAADLTLSGLSSWSVASRLPSASDLPDGTYYLIGYPFDVEGNTRYHGITGSFH